MKTYKIAREVREQILERVKSGGMSVTDIAKEHGVNPTTVYEWLKEGVEGTPSLEVMKLKKENLELKFLVAELSLRVSRTQKKK